SVRPVFSGGAPVTPVSEPAWASSSPSLASARLAPAPSSAGGVVPARRAACRASRRSAWRCFARWRSRATTPTAYRAGEGDASPGLLVVRVPSAPAAVLAKLDPVRIVALRLLALVIAPLAL